MPDSPVKLNHPQAFAQQFIDAYLRQGFGALGKRDVELLLFFLLERHEAIDRDATNYDVARQLRLTLGKVRGLRRDAYARWGALLESDTDDQLRAVLRRLLEVEAVKRAMKHVSSDQRADGFIAVRVEHPVDREELEQAIRNVGGLPEYGRNKDILLLQFDVLLDIAETLGFEDVNVRKAARYLKTHAKEVKDLGDLLAKDLSDITPADVRKGLNSAAIEVVQGTPGAAFDAVVKAMWMLI